MWRNCLPAHIRYIHVWRNACASVRQSIVQHCPPETRGLSVYFRSHNERQCRPGTSTGSYFAVCADTQHSGRVIQGIVDYIWRAPYFSEALVIAVWYIIINKSEEYRSRNSDSDRNVELRRIIFSDSFICATIASVLLYVFHKYIRWKRDRCCFQCDERGLLHEKCLCLYLKIWGISLHYLHRHDDRDVIKACAERRRNSKLENAYASVRR